MSAMVKALSRVGMLLICDVAFVKLFVPREEAPIRQVELLAAGIEANVQVKPDGKVRRLTVLD